MDNSFPSCYDEKNVRGDFMKRIPILLLLVLPYGYLGVCSFEGLTAFALTLWPILWLCIVLPNLIYAWVLPRLGASPRMLLFWTMLLKLCHIPVYALVFFLVMLLNIMLIPLIPLLFLFDVSLLVGSSMYGASGLYQAHRAGFLSTAETVLLILLQFLFCLDVFSAIYAYVRVRRQSSSQAPILSK